MYNILGSLFLVFGVVFLVNSLSGITGLVVIEDVPSSDSGFIGGVFILEGVALFILAQRKRKKGQAAMEFLMTYGWAILAAIIAIGILAYFGVFRASLSPNVAYLNSPFYVNSWTVQQQNVQFEVRNDGKDITIQSFNIRPKDLNENRGFIYCIGSTTMPIKLKSQSSVVFKSNCAPLSVGNPFRAELTLTYTTQDSNILFETRGYVQDTIKTDVFSQMSIITTTSSQNVGGGNPAQPVGVTGPANTVLKVFLVDPTRKVYPQGTITTSGSGAGTTPAYAIPITPKGTWAMLFTDVDSTSISPPVFIEVT